MRTTCLATLLSLLSCTGCDAEGGGGGAGGGGGESGGPHGDEPAWLEVGAGSTAFEALAAGDAVELVMGPQGGWHVDVAARFGGMSPEGLTLEYLAIDVETGAELGFPIKSALNADRVEYLAGACVRTGDRVVFDIAGPADVVGREVELRIEARGPEDEVGASVVVGIADMDP